MMHCLTLPYSFSVNSVLKDWPIHGGKDLRTDSSTNDLLLTGSLVDFMILFNIYFLFEFLHCYFLSAFKWKFSYDNSVFRIFDCIVVNALLRM